MRFSNANSFKAKIKNIAKEKGLSAQQIQQNYLIEQVLRLIANSRYQSQFIVKGGFLIGNMIGIDKRSTMDLDITLKGAPLSEKYLREAFQEILMNTQSTFRFEIDRITSIRKDDVYGGYSLKLNALFDTLREAVYIDITTGDEITPKEIDFSLKSVFDNDAISVLTYNLETILAEKLETVLSRSEASTRPRDRYDLYTLVKLNDNEIDFGLLEQALKNTCQKRNSEAFLLVWETQIFKIKNSAYQKLLWANYQKSFKYASTISFEESVEIIVSIMNHLLL